MSDKFDLGGLLKQAQALQERLASAQEDLAKRVVEGTAGGGMVTVTVNGRLEVLSVRIDPTLLVEPDGEMLQDLVVAAVNAAIHAAQRIMGEEMGKLGGGLGIKLPGMG
jgi:DNA-binding YbaB/EbfC family protein